MTALPLSHYGAIGDGVSDDSYAIMLSFARQGSAIMEAECTYKHTITLNCEGYDIIGASNAKFVYHGEGHGYQHYSGQTRLINADLQGMHNTVKNGKFGLYTAPDAVGNVVMLDSQIHGFTNSFVLEQYLQDCVISGYQTYDLLGDESGEGYGGLVACNGFVIDDYEAIGDRTSGNGRHGLYITATAKNGKVYRPITNNFAEGGLVLFAFSHQSGISNIDIYSPEIDNCAGGIYNGNLGIFGKVDGVNLYGYKSTNSKGNGLYVSAHGQQAVNNLNVYNSDISNSDYMGVAIFGVTNTNFFNDKVHNSSLASVQSFSNFGVYSDYNNNIQTDGLAIHALQSTTDANKSRNQAYVNPSAPAPANVTWHNVTWDSTNFAEAENI